MCCNAAICECSANPGSGNVVAGVYDVFVAQFLVHCSLLPSATDIFRTPVQVLGQGAVHGAFAGYTGFTVGLVNTHYVYLPIPGTLLGTVRADALSRRCK